MTGPGLPTSIVELAPGHLGHTNTVHGIVNKFDTTIGTASDGQVLTWDTTTSSYRPIWPSPTGYVNVKDPAYGATGDGSTDDTTAVVAARNAVLNSRTGSPITGAPTLPILWFPPGSYRVTSPDVLLPTGGDLIEGYTIAGSGPYTSKILFQPSGGSSTLTNMNLMTAAGASAPRLAGLTIRDICFDSNNANASLIYLFSTTTAWNQHALFDNVRLAGTWKRGWGLDGDTNSNLNSEMTFRRIMTTGASFSDAVVHSGLTTPGSFPNEDQFLNYWFYDCKMEQATGNTLIFDKGGQIVVNGGSWIVGDSGSGTHFKMGDYGHYQAVENLSVTGVRFELRNTNCRVIDCAWRAFGHVTFRNCSDSSHYFLYQINGTGGGAANYDTHIYRTPQNQGPIVRYEDCSLMGYHRVVSTATVPDAFKTIYNGCDFWNMQSGGVSLLSSATSQFLRYDSAVPHYRFQDCQGTTDVNA